jgi:sugar phosphate isomerase/epimerase
MRKLGFSTGTLAKGNICKALQMVSKLDTDAVEYSALRFDEFQPSVDYLMHKGTGCFNYVAFHAPSKFDPSDEQQVVNSLMALVQRHNLHVVVHPDAIHDYELWNRLGENLCVENMDHRKPIGRTADELDAVFRMLPKARLCFDIGHAHEIDRSMSMGYEILRRHGNRIAHLHASEVSDECRHRPFSPSSHGAFAKLAGMIPESVPVVLETVTTEDRVGQQLREARDIFNGASKP